MQKLGQRNDIQGLRAIAVLSVILYHMNKAWLPGGFIGVDLFLVISGFLITSILLRDKAQGHFSFLAFYRSRIKRILPAYIALLIILTPLAALILIPDDFERYYKSLKAALYFNGNNFFAGENDYFAPASHELPLLHTWSLAIEMQFYLLLPIFLFVLPRALAWPLSLCLILGLSLYASWQIAEGARQATYFSLWARIPEFLIGGLLAFKPETWRWSDRTSNLAAVLGLILVLASFWFISEESPFPGLMAWPACIGAALLIAARGSRVGRWLETPILVWLGALSYSLYLWHWPILAGARYLYESYALPGLVLLVIALVTLLCSYLSYRFVEQPFRRIRTGRMLAGLAVLGLAGVLVVKGSRAMNPVIVPPLPLELTRYADGSQICHGRIVGGCLRGDSAAEREILLIGDSHAAQLNHFADVVGQALPARFRVISASSCVTIEGFDVDRLPEWARADCVKQINEVKNYLASVQTVILAGMWQFQSPSEAFMRALDHFLAEAEERGQNVLVLSQIPMLASNVQRMRRFEHFGMLPRIALNEQWAASNARVAELVARHGNSRFLDFTTIPLLNTPPYANGQLIYHDNHHLNEIGSKLYGEAVAGLLKQHVDAIMNGSR